MTWLKKMERVSNGPGTAAREGRGDISLMAYTPPALPSAHSATQRPVPMREFIYPRLPGLFFFSDGD